MSCPNCSGVNVDWFLLRCPECGASEGNGWDPAPSPPVHRIADSLGEVARQLWENRENSDTPKRAAKPGRTAGALSVSLPDIDETITIFGSPAGPIVIKQSDFIRMINQEINRGLGVKSSLLGDIQGHSSK